jgi:hypothetical protein
MRREDQHRFRHRRREAAQRMEQVGRPNPLAFLDENIPAVLILQGDVKMHA